MSSIDSQTLLNMHKNEIFTKHFHLTSKPKMLRTKCIKKPSVTRKTHFPLVKIHLLREKTNLNASKH